MANVRNYRYQNTQWVPAAVDFTQMCPSASDQKLVVSSTCTRFEAFDPTVTHVMWHSDGGNFMVRFSGSAPSATCGHFFWGAGSGLWSACMASCAVFIRAGNTDASLFATPLT
jgi:hypothetical protein